MLWKTLFVVTCALLPVFADDPIVEITETDPLINELYNQIIVEKDRDAQLRCTVQNKPKDNDVQWQAELLNSTVAISSATAVKTDPFKYSIDQPSPTSWRLRVQNAQVTDEGKYICRVQTGFLIYVTSFEYLRVIEKPQIADLQTSSDIVAKQGDDITLRCNATGRPFPVVKWRRLAGELLPTGGEELREFHMPVLQIRPDNAGVYICLADNEAGHDERRIVVTVTHKPIVEVENKNVLQAVGYVKSLVCNVKANPEPYVSWSRGDIPIESSDHIDVRTIVGALNKVTSVLTIHGVRTTDFGDYTCVAVNTQGDGFDTMSLKYSAEPTPDRTGQLTSSASLLAISFITLLMVISTCLLQN